MAAPPRRWPPATRHGARAYAGPLLPRSEAPGVVRLRGLLEDRLRRAVLARGDPELLRRWAQHAWGEDDLEVVGGALTARCAAGAGGAPAAARTLARAHRARKGCPAASARRRKTR